MSHSTNRLVKLGIIPLAKIIYHSSISSTYYWAFLVWLGIIPLMFTISSFISFVFFSNFLETRNPFFLKPQHFSSQTAGVNIDHENKKKTPILQSKLTINKNPHEKTQGPQKDKVAATNVKHNSGEWCWCSLFLFLNLVRTVRYIISLE